MADKQTLNIIYFPLPQDNLANYIEESMKDSSSQLFTYFTKQKDLFSFLQLLDADTPFLFWIHYRFSGGRPNIGVHQRFVKRFPNLIARYITFGEIAAINGVRVIGTNHLAGNFSDGEQKCEIYSYRVFLESLQIPAPQKVGKVFYPAAEPKAYKYSSEEEIDVLGDWLFDQQLNEQSLAPDNVMGRILGGVFGNPAEKDFELSVLAPGFSGAYLILVSYKFKEETRTAILKIAKNKAMLEREIRFINEYVLGRSEKKMRSDLLVTPQKFKGDFILQIYDWHILQMFASDSMTTFRKVASELGSIKHLAKPLLKSYRKFQDILGGKPRLRRIRNLFEDYFYEGKETNYRGLYLGRAYQQKINNYIDRYVKISDLKELGTAYHITNEQRNKLKEFVINKEYGSKLIGKFACAPVATIHGDFHGGNIMANEKGKKIQFIDFAHTRGGHRYHAFSDLARLAVDMEMELIPDWLLYFQKKSPLFFQIWIDHHRSWIRTPILENGQLASYEIHGHPALDKCYAFNHSLWTYAVGLAKELNPKISQPSHAFSRQFHLVRVYNMFKYIAYPSIPHIKKLYIIRAIID
ncbi:MAG: hypothetical protein AAF985_26940, partial [Bacteroidota bacterium]